MSSKRRSSTKKRSAQPSTATASSATATAVAPKPPPQPAPPPKQTKPKETAPSESRFRTMWDNFSRMVENTLAEIKKITWPDWETTRNLTVLVIVMAVFLGAVLGGIDFVLLQVFEAF